MLYFGLLLGAVLCGFIALGGLVLGIVMAVKQRWGLAVGAAIMCFVFLLGAGGLLAGTFIRARSDARARRDQLVQSLATQGLGFGEFDDTEMEDRRTAREKEIKKLTPAVDWVKVDREWWEWDIHPDWWRSPMRWPYEVRTDNDWEVGEIRRNTAGGKSTEDDHTVAAGDHKFDRYTYDATMCVYRVNVAADQPQKWGIFTFESGQTQEFVSEAAMWEAARRAGWTGKEELPVAEAVYDRYWGYAE